MKRARGKNFITPSLILALFAGVVIWGKLRLVTSVPRTAYAEPRASHDERASDAARDAQASGSELELRELDK